jgi:hypothetical protein
MSNRLTDEQIERNKREILSLFRGIKREGIEKLCDWLSSSDFFYAPASTMHHGNFRGGLAAHSYEIYKEFDKRADNYSLRVPKESRVISSILHDACKIDTYIENKLKDGEVSGSKPYKVNNSFPFGHGEKSVLLVQRHIELTEQESMLIRWHMGPYEQGFEDYQDAIEKYFPECILFHHIDKEVSLLRKL